MAESTDSFPYLTPHGFNSECSYSAFQRPNILNHDGAYIFLLEMDFTVESTLDFQGVVVKNIFRENS